MRLSGVDPGIIRELSGIYKPFIKAFKELISNAYDADAKTIDVTIAEDFSTVDVLDDGGGMTPYQFQTDFARLGGSTAWLQGGKSPGGRDRIGYKGIGFLAVARYCSQLRVTSRSARPHENSHNIRRGRKSVPLDELVGDLLPTEMAAGRVRIVSVDAVVGTKATRLKDGKDFKSDKTSVQLLSERARTNELTIRCQVDCSHLVLEAALDFDYLLGLEHRADLRTLDNFCKLKLRRATDADRSSFTKVRLHGIKDFVRRELSAPATKGKARNITFKSGKEQFLWRLARSSPIADEVPDDVEGHARVVSNHLATADLPIVRVRWRADAPIELKRQVYLGPSDRSKLKDTTFPINIDEGGLKVVGYLVARSEIIYPAELRGLTVRVRHVAIGDPSFLGWEHILSGPRKAALSQISGELLVLEGLEAADAINPGRESFYEENPQYRILKRELFGVEETIGGHVGSAVRTILDRIRIRSQVNDRITEARQRRKTLGDISSAVNFYARADGKVAEGLSSFFRGKQRANGLAQAKDINTRPGPRLAGFDVEISKALDSDYRIDYEQRKVFFNLEQDAWKTSIYLDRHFYEVLLKQGRPEQAICEFDNKEHRIYVNWAHPAKQQMNDAAFLKSAILLRLAYHAAPTNADAMMELALNMLSFRVE